MTKVENKILAGGHVTMSWPNILRNWGTQVDFENWAYLYQVKCTYIGCGYYQIYKQRINRRKEYS